MRRSGAFRLFRGFRGFSVSFVSGIEFLTDPGDAAMHSRPVWFVGTQAGRVTLELRPFFVW
jgi:hypothetical protein